MGITQYKPKIVNFQKNQWFLAIDWETLKQGFSITVEHGDAIIHILPEPTSQIRGAIGAGIGAEQISRFFLRQESGASMTEVVLELTFEPKERSLGLTDNVKEAEDWVRNANVIVEQHRPKD